MISRGLSNKFFQLLQNSHMFLWWGFLFLIIIRAANHREGSEKQMIHFLLWSLCPSQIKTLLQKRNFLPLRYLVMYVAFSKKHDGDIILCDLDIIWTENKCFIWQERLLWEIVYMPFFLTFLRHCRNIISLFMCIPYKHGYVYLNTLFSCCFIVVGSFDHYKD